MAAPKALEAGSSEHPTLEELLQRNKEFAISAAHQPMPYLTEIPDIKLPSAMVVSCCDMRADPASFLQVPPGEVIVVRCMGGRIGTVLSDLVTMDALFKFREVVIVHHTDCGVTYLAEPAVRAYLKSVLPDAGESEIQNHPVRVFSDDSIEESVRDDLKIVRDSPLVRKGVKDAVSGFVYDIKSGAMKRIQ